MTFFKQAPICHILVSSWHSLSSICLSDTTCGSESIASRMGNLFSCPPRTFKRGGTKVAVLNSFATTTFPSWHSILSSVTFYSRCILTSIPPSIKHAYLPSFLSDILQPSLTSLVRLRVNFYSCILISIPFTHSHFLAWIVPIFPPWFLLPFLL